VGSLTEVQHQIVIGSLLGDGAMRCKTNALLEINHSSHILAVWFMDDGCRSRSAVYLNTQQYDMASQRRLLRLLREQWGIEAALNRDKAYYRVRLTVDGTRRFAGLVEPHLLPELRYKLPQMTP
jgi:hypothetical protein